jgi:glycosyltransferase involved in cell wall biosynthesis
LKYKRILGLGTYPIQNPVHGGQRRVAAFKCFYERSGITYSYACIYNSNHYRGPDVGPFDLKLIVPESEIGLEGVIGDLISGRQGASDAASFQHFMGVVERLSPDALQLEQPFMWPLAKRLRQTWRAGKLPVIYSSHNVEAPLKQGILLSGGMAPDLRSKICSEIEGLEAELVREADLIVCVSAADQEYYCKSKSLPDVIVVPNGTDRPYKSSMDRSIDSLRVFEGRPYLMTVGSAHPPNIDGICSYVIKDGVFCTPPAKCIAICGGVAAAVRTHPEFQRFRGANACRVEFFADISDSDLAVIKQCCHGVLLPIFDGGGSNLKTAEALTLGKWVIATSISLRGFEAYANDGVVVANNPAEFRHAMRQVLQQRPAVIGDGARLARDALYWDRCFADSDLPKFLFDRAPACQLQ